MGRMYSASVTGVSASAAQDVFELVAPSDMVVAIHEITISQSSDVGDAAEEGLAVTLKRGATSSGSGGSSPTIAPLHFGDAASTVTVEANNTTQASAGTIVTMRADVWNVRVPYQYLPTPETRIILSPSQRFTVSIPAPADAITLSATIVFEEIGG